MDRSSYSGRHGDLNDFEAARRPHCWIMPNALCGFLLFPLAREPRWEVQLCPGEPKQTRGCRFAVPACHQRDEYVQTDIALQELRCQDSATGSRCPIARTG